MSKQPTPWLPYQDSHTDLDPSNYIQQAYHNMTGNVSNDDQLMGGHNNGGDEVNENEHNPAVSPVAPNTSVVLSSQGGESTHQQAESQDPDRTDIEVARQNFEGQRAFTQTWRDGLCTLKLNSNLTAAQRKAVSYFIPVSLNQRPLLTQAQLDAVNIHHAIVDQPYKAKGISGKDRVVAFSMSRQYAKNEGMQERQNALRALIHQPEVLGTIKKISKKYGKRVHEFGPTWQPHDGRWSLKLSKLTRNASKFPYKKIVHEATDIFSTLLEKIHPEINSTARELRWYATAAIPFGSNTNKGYFSAMRLNESNFDQSLGVQLGKWGGPHLDMHDEPTTLTCLADISNPGNNNSLGVVSVLPFGLIMGQEVNGASFFTAGQQHTGLGAGLLDIPEEFPLHPPVAPPDEVTPLPEGTEEKRLKIVLWGNQFCMAPEFRWLDPEFYCEDAAVNFPTFRDFYTWMMRHYIIHEPEIQWRPLVHPDPNLANLNVWGPERLFELAAHLPKGETREGIAAEAAQFTRTNDPIHYSRIFIFHDEDGNLQYPDPQEAAKTLFALSTPNPEFDELYSDMKSNLVGAYIKTKERKAAEERGEWIPGHTIHTHVNYQHVFDDNVDTIPGNPSFKPRNGTG